MKAGHDNFTRRLFSNLHLPPLGLFDLFKTTCCPIFWNLGFQSFFVFHICISWKTNKTKVPATTIKDKSFVWSSLHSILNNRKEKELLKDNDDVDDYSVSASIERAAWGATCILPSCILPTLILPSCILSSCILSTCTYITKLFINGQTPVCHNFAFTRVQSFLYLHVVLILDVPFLVPFALISTHTLLFTREIL